VKEQIIKIMQKQDLIRLIEVCQYILPQKPLDFLTKELPSWMTPESFLQYCTNLYTQFNIQKDSELDEIHQLCLKYLGLNYQQKYN
jgi:hypothetical protein